MCDSCSAASFQQGERRRRRQRPRDIFLLQSQTCPCLPHNTQDPFFQGGSSNQANCCESTTRSAERSFENQRAQTSILPFATCEDGPRNCRCRFHHPNTNQTDDAQINDLLYFRRPARILHLYPAPPPPAHTAPTDLRERGSLHTPSQQSPQQYPTNGVEEHSTITSSPRPHPPPSPS